MTQVDIDSLLVYFRELCKDFISHPFHRGMPQDMRHKSVRVLLFMVTHHAFVSAFMGGGLMEEELTILPEVLSAFFAQIVPMGSHVGVLCVRCVERQDASWTLDLRHPKIGLR